jgi:hypothetical protein
MLSPDRDEKTHLSSLGSAAIANRSTTKDWKIGAPIYFAKDRRELGKIKKSF